MHSASTRRATSWITVGLLAVGFPGSGVPSALSESSAEANCALSVATDPPGAVVYLGGQPQGRTPLTLERLAPGDHQVTVIKPGYLENSRVVSLELGHARRLDVKLTPASHVARHAVQIETDKQEKQGGSATKWALIGLGAAGAAAATYFLVKGKNRPPTVGRVSISPSGAGLLAATNFSFTAEGASDPDDDPLSFSWNFGDGSTGAGQSVTHVYSSAGTFDVTVAVSDGKASATSPGTVTVRALSGTWAGGIGCFPNRLTVTLTQTGTSLTGTFLDEFNGAGTIAGRVVAPNRDVVLVHTMFDSRFRTGNWSGSADSSLNRLTGTTDWYVCGATSFFLDRR